MTIGDSAEERPNHDLRDLNLRDLDPHRRVEAVQMLAAHGAPVEQLAPAAEDPSPYVRAALAEVLVGYSPRDAAPLLGVLMTDTGQSRGPVVHVQAAAIATIGVLGLEEYAGSVEAATCATDKRKRAAAVRAVGNLGLVSAAETVRRALRDESAQVRMRAAEAARDLGEGSLVAPLADSLAATVAGPHPHESLIRALVVALGVVDRAGTTVQQLLIVARDYRGVRGEVVRAVARMAVGHAQFHFRGLVDDGDPSIRRFALEGLLALPGEPSDGTVAGVRALVDDIDLGVQGLAWRVLHRAGAKIEPQELRSATRTAVAAIELLGSQAASSSSCQVRTDAGAALSRLADLAHAASRPDDGPAVDKPADDAAGQRRSPAPPLS